MYLKKYKYTKKLLNYSNASKRNSLLSTSEGQKYVRFHKKYLLCLSKMNKTHTG